MRVVLFFDGKNFYAGLKDQAPNQIIDFAKMSTWLVQKAGGSHLWGAYYYTGVEPAGTEGGSKLNGFLDMLELQPGFFVKRFPRKAHTFYCSSCEAPNRFTLEKEIDTTMVADMLRLAAVDAFDVLVLMSGDSDHTPAVEGVRAIGKQVYVATWGKTGLSARIRKAAFDHIDLLDGLDFFGRSAGYSSYDDEDEEEDSNDPDNPDSDVSSAPVDYDGGEEEDDLPQAALFLIELDRAQQTFQTGYVGMNYFLKRWQSNRLTSDPDERRVILNQLIEEEKVEIYEAHDGNKAIRIRV